MPRKNTVPEPLDPVLSALDFDAPAPSDVVDFRDRFLFLAGEIEHHVIMACRLFEQGLELRAPLLAEVPECRPVWVDHAYLFQAVVDAVAFGLVSFDETLKAVQ